MTPRPNSSHRISRRSVLRAGAVSGSLTTLGALTGCGDRLITAPSARASGTASPAAGSASPSASGASPSASQASGTPTGSAANTLPGGGLTFFPDHRLVGYCGEPNAPGQGRLGIGDLDTRIEESIAKGKSYTSDGRTVLPIVELIATTTLASAGSDGMYRVRSSSATIQTWLDASRRHGAYLVLNIQPGRADFLDEVKAYEAWLRQPDVGVALDPEWAVGPGERPGRVFGHTTGAKLNECAAYLASLRTDGGPEKLMVYHQLNPGVVRQESTLQAHDGVAMVKSVDGIGGPAAKTGTYKRVIATLPSFVHPGFKLFFQEDVQRSGSLMTPSAVMALTPRPDYVMYE